MFAGKVEAAGSEGEEFGVLARIGGEDCGETGLEFLVCREWVGLDPLKD